MNEQKKYLVLPSKRHQLFWVHLHAILEGTLQGGCSQHFGELNNHRSSVDVGRLTSFCLFM